MTLTARRIICLIFSVPMFALAQSKMEPVPFAPDPSAPIRKVALISGTAPLPPMVGDSNVVAGVVLGVVGAVASQAQSSRTATALDKALKEQQFDLPAVLDDSLEKILTSRGIEVIRMGKKFDAEKAKEVDATLVVVIGGYGFRSKSPLSLDYMPMVYAVARLVTPDRKRTLMLSKLGYCEIYPKSTFTKLDCDSQVRPIGSDDELVAADGPALKNLSTAAPAIARAVVDQIAGTGEPQRKP